MRSVLALLALVSLTATAQARNCNPEKSQPCGNACISKSFTCHKTGGDSVASTKGGKAPVSTKAPTKALPKK